MPRKKNPKPTPVERIRAFYGIETIDIEVWENLADIGTRGSWKKRKAGIALNLLIDSYTDKLINPLQTPTLCDRTLKRLLGHRQTSKLAEEIKPLLKRNKLFFGKTAIWLLAQELQKNFIALRNALKANEGDLPHLAIDSPEEKIKQKMLKGTF